MSDEDKMNRMGIALGAAVKVIASTCVVQGQEQLAMDIVQMFKDERFEELFTTFEGMSASGPKPTPH